MLSVMVATGVALSRMHMSPLLAISWHSKVTRAQGSITVTSTTDVVCCALRWRAELKSCGTACSDEWFSVQQSSGSGSSGVTGRLQASLLLLQSQSRDAASDGASNDHLKRRVVNVDCLRKLNTGNSNSLKRLRRHVVFTSNHCNNLYL